MKVLEICLYSAGICGVWNRVKEESVRLSKLGHEVRVFSSDFIKGESGKAEKEDKIGKVLINRFKALKIGGESYMLFSGNLKNAILDYKPEVIIAHSYRHTHTVIASRIAKKIGARSILVTHAPFGDSNRSLIAKIYIKLFHDPFVGKSTLKRFDKIVAITKWEMPYLEKLGVPKNKIFYIPNGIPEEFFNYSGRVIEENKILFLGRVSPVKDIETLIKSLLYLKNKDINLEIVGPREKDYLAKLKLLIKQKDLERRVIFSEPIYNLKDKINKIDSSKIFVMASLREGMPQSLIEAMSRKKIVVSSDNLGAKDLIKDRFNGFLFNIGDPKGLAKNIDYVLKNKMDKIKNEAAKSVKKYSWNRIIKDIDRILV